MYMYTYIHIYTYVLYIYIYIYIYTYIQYISVVALLAQEIRCIWVALLV